MGNILDWAVVIECLGVPCGCRCRHCSVNGGKTTFSVSYDRAKRVADRFIEWSKEDSRKPLKVEFTLGYSYEMPKEILLDYLRFRREHQMPGWDYLPLNGLRSRNSKGIRNYLEILREGGVKVINLTFFGLQRSHDAWAGRRGDFRYLLRLAKLFPQFGLARSEAVFLYKGNLGEIPDLLSTLDEIPGLIRREFGPWDYLGRGRGLEGERLDLSTLEMLSADLCERVDTKQNRTESSWMDAIHNNEIPEKSKRVYLIQIRDDNIEYLEKTNCREVLEGLLKGEHQYQGPEFSLQELSGRVGDKNNMKIYSLRDLEWKWLELFCLSNGKKVPAYISDPTCSHTRLR
jgi:hypothetical protein